MPPPTSRAVLVPILRDQLSPQLASLRGWRKDDTRVLLMEARDEATCVNHDKRKIALIFSAKRHFAAELAADGGAVDYARLDDEQNTAASPASWLARSNATIQAACGLPRPASGACSRPSRNGPAASLLGRNRPTTASSARSPSFSRRAQERDHLMMEFFYRDMRARQACR